MEMIQGLPVYTHGDPRKQAVLFIHGFMFNHTMWDHQVAALKDEYYCVTYDFRGMGDAPAGDGQLSLEMYVDDVEAIADTLKLEKPVLCGLSMGGYIAFRAVERAPERYKALIVCDSRASADNNGAKLKRTGGLKTINTRGINQFIADTMPQLFADTFRQNKPEVYAQIIDSARRLSATGIKACIIAMVGRLDVSDALPEFRLPVQLICGDRDVLSPPEEMKATADKIPGSRFAVIEDSGHLSPMEQPEQVNQVIATFLRSLPYND